MDYYDFIREFNLSQLRYQLISVKTRRDTSCHISKFLSYIISGLALTWLFGKIFILREWNFWRVWFRCLMGGEIMENGQLLWWTRNDFYSLRQNLSPTHFRLTDLIEVEFQISQGSLRKLLKKIVLRSFRVAQGHKFRNTVEKGQILISIKNSQIASQKVALDVSVSKNLFLTTVNFTRDQKSWKKSKKANFEFHQKCWNYEQKYI